MNSARLPHTHLPDSLAAPMDLPHKISTLLYGFTPTDDVVLIERTQEPNRGHWSPPGGKLKTWMGESPYACACREASEEMNLLIRPTDLHLTGLISEVGYQGTTHWLMFLFEIRTKIRSLPEPHREGRFCSFKRAELGGISLPETDRDFLWPMFWEHRGGFFSAHAVCIAGQDTNWTLEESIRTPSVRVDEREQIHE